MIRALFAILALAAALAVPAAAQYYPTPYPGEWPDMGTPRAPKTPTAEFRGTAKSVTSKKLTVEMDDSNTVEFRLSKKTVCYRGDKKVKIATVEAGAPVTVEATRAPDNSLDALTVRIERPKS